MQRETYTETVTETSISISESSVQAVRTKNISKHALRLYDGRHIGIAGSLGHRNDAALEATAKEALDRQIAYPFEPASAPPRHESVEATISDSEAFVAEIEGLLDELGARHPGFRFSNKANLATRSARMANDNGLDFSYGATTAEVELIVKEEESANLFDTFVGFDGPRYSREAVLAVADIACGTYRNLVDLPTGRVPVCFLATDTTYLSKMLEALHGLLLGSGSSLFSGKIGERLFADRLTIRQSRARADEIYRPFFDFEGTTNAADSVALIEDGVLRTGYTNRNYARTFGLPLTGAATGEYDAVPDLGAPNLVVDHAGRTAAELLDGRPALLVFVAAGGDFTPDGAFASPVQVGYVFDGEGVVGKAPEAAVSSHLYSMFGDDFIGVSSDSLFPDTSSRLFIAEMDVTTA